MSPSQSRPRVGRVVLCVHLAIGLAAATLCGFAAAQPALPAPAGADVSAAERAKRDADKVFQWIRIHSDKPRKAAVAPPTPAAAPAAAVVVAKPSRPANRPNDGGIKETVTPIAAGIQAPRSSPEPERTAVAATPVVAEAEAEPSVTPAGRRADTIVAAAAPSAREVEEDLTLIPVHRTEPEFSPVLMRQLRKGMVQVSFTVSPDGTVAKAQAVSSTHPRLKDAAVATVAQWRFQPLRHAQQGVVDIGFNLD